MALLLLADFLDGCTLDRPVAFSPGDEWRIVISACLVLDTVDLYDHLFDLSKLCGTEGRNDRGRESQSIFEDIQIGIFCLGFLGDFLHNSCFLLRNLPN